MSWTIERRGRVAVVTMTTNPVNAQNHAFFAGLHDAFDRLQRDHRDSPVVLTGTARRFSAGLDLDEHFRLFAGDPAAAGPWFAGYRATNMRLFTYPRPTVAAINGHAFAGGLITAAVCDHRIAVTGDASFGLNEVPIGIPMPAVYVRMLAYAWGEPVAARTSPAGEIFTPAQTHALGMVRELVPAGDLPDRAVAIAGHVPEDCLEQDAFTKRACQAAALRDITDIADPSTPSIPSGSPASTPSTYTAATGSSSKAAQQTGNPHHHLCWLPGRYGRDPLTVEPEPEELFIAHDPRAQQSADTYFGDN